MRFVAFLIGACLWAGATALLIEDGWHNGFTVTHALQPKAECVKIGDRCKAWNTRVDALTYQGQRAFCRDGQSKGLPLPRSRTSPLPTAKE